MTYQDPSLQKGMNPNIMRNMTFGSPIHPSLPHHYQNGGIILDAINHALDDTKMVVKPYREQARSRISLGILPLVKTKQMTDGGKVKGKKGRPPKEILMKVETKGVDNVPALLQAGEVVIPKKYVKKVSKFLKKEKIHLPNM
jgi:hypothetical protein